MKSIRYENWKSDKYKVMFFRKDISVLMVMVTRLRTDNTIATTKRKKDGVHRDKRVTVTQGSP